MIVSSEYSSPAYSNFDSRALLAETKRVFGETLQVFFKRRTPIAPLCTIGKLSVTDTISPLESYLANLDRSDIMDFLVAVNILHHELGLIFKPIIPAIPEQDDTVAGFGIADADAGDNDLQQLPLVEASIPSMLVTRPTVQSP